MTDEIDNDQTVPEPTPEPRLPNGKFAPGFTGNPKGRPKKNRLKPIRGHVDAQVVHMMLREHTFAENGQTKKLPFIVWLLKKMQADALKGDRFAQKRLLDWFSGTLERRHEEKTKAIETMYEIEKLHDVDMINLQMAIDYMDQY